MIQVLKLRAVALVMTIRKFFYRAASTAEHVTGSFKAVQPVVLKGKGQIIFGNQVTFGVVDSPMFYNTYTYIEARTAEARISFGNNVHLNNQCAIISEAVITIGNDVLIGLNCTLSDSNFHDLDKNNRQQTDPCPKAIHIENNVFIGNNVTILKGVSIGENSVIAAGSIVTKSFPANVCIGGAPAKILNTLS